MDSAKTLSIHIVAWNSARYLPELFASLDAQTSKDFTVTVVDNASADGTASWLMEHRPDVVLLKNNRNQGFARGHNQAIALALQRWTLADLEKRYVMIANPDLEFSPDAMAHLIAFMDAHPEVAVCAPKLLRTITSGNGDDGRLESERTQIIDAMGITLTKARRPIDRGAGEEDKGQYDADTRIFGPSGACAVYRASALIQAKIGEDFFDEEFFAYQEDVDLAWRMRLLGMEARLVPSAVVWHHRAAQSIPRGNWLAAWRLRRTKSAHINAFSTRNHGWLLLKNDQGSSMVLHLPWWLPYEAAKLIASVISPTQIKAQFASLAGIPRMLRKRRDIQKRTVASAAEMRKWFI